MHERFGRAFDDIDMRRKGPGSRFMTSWESVKRGFGGQNDTQVKEIGPLNLKGIENSPFYDEEESMVRLTRFVWVSGNTGQLLTDPGKILRAFLLQWWTGSCA
jgi:hypothetical protein